jgi:hypothetical protein
MPIPGPRDQTGPLPGYRNPGFEQPTFFNQWDRPGPVYWPGRSPGLMTVTLRGCVLGAGQIRRLWKQAVDLIPAQGPYSWTNSSTDIESSGVLGITRALRYMTHSLYIGAGNDNSRYENLHTVIQQRHPYKMITVAAGSVPGRPTTRNRLTSFGSRVPTLNSSVVAAQNQRPGGATQS